MTRTAPRLDRRGRAALQAERQRLWAQAEPEGGAWHAGSSVLSGVLLGGGAGWLLDRWLDGTWLLPVGVLLGTALGMTSLWFRYGVARPTEEDARGTGDGAGLPLAPPTDRRPVRPSPAGPSPVEDAP